MDRFNFRVTNQLKALAKCAALDATRYAMDNVFVSRMGGKSFACASDGRIAAIVPLETFEPNDGDNSALIPADTLGRLSTAVRNPPACAVNGQIEITVANGTMTQTELPVGRYPAIGEVLPDETSLDGRLCIHLDARALLKVANAITNGDEPGVRLYIEPTTKRAIVAVGSNGVGAVMPMSKSNRYGSSENEYLRDDKAKLKAVVDGLPKLRSPLLNIE